MLVGAVTIGGSCAADAVGQQPRCRIDSLSQRQIVAFGKGIQESVHGPVPPFERGVILCDLPLLVEAVPCVYLNGHAQILQCGEGEYESGQYIGIIQGDWAIKHSPSRSRSDVLAGREVQDLVRRGVSKQGKFFRIGGNVGEQAKEVLGVEFSAIEGAGDVDTALDIVGEEGGIDGFGLCVR